MNSAPTITFLLCLISLSRINAEYGNECTNKLGDKQCDAFEACLVKEEESVGKCDCIPGYFAQQNACVKSSNRSDDAEERSTSWTLCISIFITVVIVVAYLSYKLKLISKLKYKLSQRYDRSYDDVMIGQDDD